MATTVTEATLDRPLDDAMTAVRQVAGAQGYTLGEGLSGPTQLVFRRGMKAFSWGSGLTVTFQAVTAEQTRLTVQSSEMALLDLGRSKKAARKLLEALGAQT